ncbi:hypothetical protein BBF96_13140 [Anoxybacter fermentans]|uniref:DnaB/C C-terminal domain-containing protein n=1 Tax=Anoxybacter fermentans TaxID=1323375 RepID=A0A3Q9HTW0_9FIRM|nr:DnaD domain protein [Anoxybacter fermentans]AZR74262.1 hypothetical protein BBF96_13140 [Anoxybacter fermentans]
MKLSGQLKINHTQELILNQDGSHSIRINQSVELTRKAVDAGFLKNLPGSMLSVYIYLLTHIGQDFSLTTTPTKMANYLPHSPIEIELTLKMLETQGYIKLKENIDTEKSYTITLAKSPAVISNESFSDDLDLNFNQKSNSEDDVIKYILKQKAFSEKDLVRAISAMIPIQNLDAEFRNEIDYWFNTFDKEVIKELIRRTDEAKKRDPELNCKAYMQKIANEWIADQIFTLPDLVESDKIYRETRSLIEEFGIEKFNEITRTHLKTIHSWINAESEDDFALSVEVARFAIQEAIRRKSDGRPSLNYIEDNFIKPFKEHKIKTVEEAREFLLQRSTKPITSYKEKLPTRDTKESKWHLGKDYTRFRKN